VEARNEFGPPVLSKIPYVNRMFKNVGIGRTTVRTYLVVTPRVLEVPAEPAAQR
jgi:general secretion pathway protein D